jgi:signal transduction histidine kinase
MLTLTMNQHVTQVKSAQVPYFPGQQSATGLMVVDGYQIIFADRAAEQMAGYEPGRLTGCLYDEILPDGADLLARPGLTWETELRQQDGRFIPVQLTVTPLPQSSSQLVTIVDLGHVAMLTQALIHTQRLAAVGTMTSSVAHEITNPLSIITNTCSNIHHELQSDELSISQLQRYIQMIEQSAWRCVRIVDSLRNYTYDGDTSMAVTDLNIIAAEAITLVEQQFLKEFNVTIKTDLDAQLKSILCDHDRIIQVVINLLINARNAMQPDGGIIRLKTWCLTERNEATGNGYANGATGSKRVKTYYALSVTDTGHGIQPHLLPQLFEPFFTTRPRGNGAGSGLGLFIAREIINQHNGRIWAENNPDGGATFTILLPQKRGS